MQFYFFPHRNWGSVQKQKQKTKCIRNFPFFYKILGTHSKFFKIYSEWNETNVKTNLK